jgi:stearoyl-CoA desaturase (delta-9 desaturase)
MAWAIDELIHGPSFDDQPGDSKQRKAIDAPYLHRLQRIHFTLFGIIPFLGTLAAIGLLFVRPIGAVEISLFLTMWVLTGFGISVGYHRLFTHRSFTAAAPVRALLAIFGSMAGQGGLISWSAMHRRHHECGDREGDMHSPNLSGKGWRGMLQGFLHAHVTWMTAHPYPNVAHYAPDLLGDPVVRAISRHYYRWVLLGFLIPTLLGGLLTWSWIGCLTGFLWGGMVRMFVLEHGIWSLKSLCHMFGSRRFMTRDKSRNIALLAPFVFGESWHHNHHAFPNSAYFGLAWYRVDPGYWLIRLLQLLGLASQVRVPSHQQIAHRSQGLIAE